MKSTKSLVEPASGAEGARGRLSQELIIAEAARLFKRDGYRKTSLVDLAELLDVTRPAFYYYFKSKSDILVAIQRNAMDGLSAAAAEVDSLDLDDRTRFWRHIQSHIEYVAQNWIEVGVIFEEEAELPDNIAEAVRKRNHDYTERLVQLYRSNSTRSSEECWLAVNTILGAATWTYRWYRPSLGTPAEFAAAVTNVLRGTEA